MGRPKKEIKKERSDKVLGIRIDKQVFEEAKPIILKIAKEVETKLKKS